MKIRSILLAVGLAALIASPALGTALRGQIVEVGLDTITVQGDDGRTVTLLVPSDVQIEAPQQQRVALHDLQAGQRVTLVVAEPAQEEAEAPKRSEAIHIRIEGDEDDDD